MTVYVGTAVSDKSRSTTEAAASSGAGTMSAGAAFLAGPSFLAELLEATRSIGVVLDRAGSIVACSRSFAELIEEPPEAVLNRPLWEIIREPVQAREFQELVGRVGLEGLPPRSEYTWHMSDGTRRVMSFVRCPVYGVDGRMNWVLSIALDVTADRLLDEALRRTNRSLRVLSRFNEALVRARSEEELLAAACRTLVDIGGYRLAWVGFAEHGPEQLVRPVAVAGEHPELIYSSRLSWGEGPHGNGPSGRAIRTGRPQVVRDMQGDPSMAVWYEQTSRGGYASAATLPLLEEDLAFGALSVYSGEPEAFDAEDVALLGELAEDLTYGLLSLRGRRRREQVENALRANQERLARIIDTMPGGLVIADRTGLITFANPGAMELLGMEAEDLGRHRCTDPIWCMRTPSGEGLPAEARPFERVLATSQPVQGTELALRALHGTQRVLSVNAAPLRDTQGQVIGVISSLLDITQIRATAQALQEERDFSSTVLDTATTLTIVLDAEGRIVRFSQACERLSGYTAAEAQGQRIGPLLLPREAWEGEEAVHRAVVAGPQHPQSGEAHWICKDGRRRLISWSAALVPDERGLVRYVVTTGIDITEQRAAEQALAVSEERYRGLIERIYDCVWEMDAEFRFTYISPRVVDLLGYQPEEMAGRPLVDFMDPGELAWMRSRVSAEGVLLTSEHAMPHKDGRTVFLETSAVSRWDAEGRLIGFSGINRDITARKQAERNLDSFFASSPAGLAIIDDELRFVRVNDTAAQIHGTPVEAHVGRRIDEILPQLAGLLVPMCRRVLESGEAVLNISVSGETPSQPGVARYWIASYYPIRDAGGVPRQVGSSMVELTEQQRAEDALRESEARFRSLVNAAFDGVVISAEGLILEVDPTVAATFGYELHEMIGMEVAALYAPEVREEMMREYVLPNSERPYEALGVRKDGTTFLFAACGRLAPYHGQTVRVAALRDLSDRERAAQELERSLAQLRSAMEGVVQVLASTVESRDPYTAGHQRRTAELAGAIARHMQLPQARVEAVTMAAAIHDIGKISVPAEILSRPGKISELEMSLIRTHSRTGYEVLATVDFPWPIADIVLQHHERLDGSGYPEGLTDGAISLEARILAVADVVEAMASHRPYRPARGIEPALAEIAAGKGVLYDPEVAEACLSLVLDKGFAFTAPERIQAPHPVE